LLLARQTAEQENSAGRTASCAFAAFEIKRSATI
jgi:hypothetical protein